MDKAGNIAIKKLDNATAIITTEDGVTTSGLQVYLNGINNTGTDHTDEMDEFVWKDLSGNNHDGTLFNSESSGGKWENNGLRMSSEDHIINLGEINSNYQSIEATFKVDNLDDKIHIIGNWESGGRRNIYRC
jgi:hypothetical protein